jgi:hypothetical protein
MTYILNCLQKDEFLFDFFSFKSQLADCQRNHSNIKRKVKLGSTLLKKEHVKVI